MVPTATLSPGWAVMWCRLPLAGASTSIAALSVSISNRAAPFWTISPSATCQTASVPWVMSISTLGRMTSTGILNLAADKAAGGGLDGVNLRHRSALQIGVIWHRRIRPPQAQDRCVKIIERIAFGHHGADFRAHAKGLDPLVNHHQASGFPHRGQNRLMVDWPDRAQVDHFGADAFGGQFLGSLKRAVQHDRTCNDGHIGSGAAQQGLADGGKVAARR